MNNLIKTLAAVLIIALLSAGIAYAVYTMTSNTLDVPVAAQYTLTLTANITSATVGDGIHLTATCNDDTFTGQVTFKDGSVTLGSSTAASGIATYDYTVNTAKTYHFVASATHN